MIDIHCHILPGIDDGSKSWEITLQMCRLAIEDGITHIVATPHADDTYTYSRDHVRETVAELSHRINGQLNLSIACDFHLSFKNIEAALLEPHRFIIAAKQYLLVELSDYGIPPQVSDGLVKLQAAGMVPIITHPERNGILQKRPERILEWVNSGCLVQITASSIIGAWGNTAQRIATWLLERNSVHVIASDAHDDKHRKPILSEARDAVSRRFGADFAQALVLENPAAVIAGLPLPSSQEALRDTSQKLLNKIG
jgi:protein-tyrosine phosphatase